MAPIKTLFRSARPLFRSRAPFAPQTQNAFSRFTVRSGRRYQSTAPVADAAPNKSWLGALWTSPVGPKTVHFWAPVMKWAIVLAGVSDFYRPAEKLSLTQNIAITCTGIIWTRWCLIIKPKNYFLASVNFCLGCVGLVQVGRIVAYNRSVEKKSTGEQVSEVKDGIVASAEGIKNDVKAAVAR